MPAAFTKSALPTINSACIRPGVQRMALPPSDPLLAVFLEFLARDVRQHPEHLTSISAKEREEARRLTEVVSFDLATPLTGLDDD